MYLSTEGIAQDEEKSDSLLRIHPTKGVEQINMRGFEHANGMYLVRFIERRF